MRGRAFVITACSGILSLSSLPAAAERPRAPFGVIYSNDTTNITSCISPYRKNGEPISDDRLRASIDEAREADVQLLQPGLGWIPWWKSSVPPAGKQAASLNKQLELLWIACGDQDFLFERNQKFHAVLGKHGIEHDYLATKDDAHAWPVWRRYLADFAPKLFRN